MSKQTLDGSRVLIVDDDPDVRALIRGLFDGRGHLVHDVGSGAAVRACMRHEDFDLVLLDLGLPDEDGMVLARWIKSRRATPFVVVTVRGGQADRLAALEAGADDYVTKPFDPIELVLRIENILRRYRASHRHPSMLDLVRERRGSARNAPPTR